MVEQGYRKCAATRIAIARENGYILVWTLAFTLLLSAITVVVWQIKLQHGNALKRNFDTIRNSYLAEGAINRILVDLEQNPFKPIDTSFSYAGGAKVDVRSTPKGLLASVRARASSFLSCVELEALVGTRNPIPDGIAIITTDRSSPLTLAGTTRVVGDILTGPRGIRLAPDETAPFSGSHEGARYVLNAPRLPDINAHLLNETFRRFDNRLNAVQSGSNSHPIARDLLLLEPGLFPPEAGRSSSLIVNGNVEIGNRFQIPAELELIVSGRVSISGNVRFDSVIVYARDGIAIKGHTAGSGQFISPASISVAEEVRLFYPTWLVVHGEPGERTTIPRISVEGRSRIDGGIVWSRHTEPSTNQTQSVYIGASARVRGGVFNSGSTQVSGTILGSVVTSRFIAFDTIATRLNTILNASIRLDERPDPFHWPSHVFQRGQLDVISIRTGECSTIVGNKRKHEQG